jgi:hypothetical protein
MQAKTGGAVYKNAFHDLIKLFAAGGKRCFHFTPPLLLLTGKA